MQAHDNLSFSPSIGSATCVQYFFFYYYLPRYQKKKKWSPNIYPGLGVFIYLIAFDVDALESFEMRIKSRKIQLRPVLFQR